MTNIKETFAVTSGSVVGRHHLGHHPQLVGHNNQDAVGVLRRDDYSLLVASDGCGAGDFSEFGSRLLVTSALRGFRDMLERYAHTERFGKQWLDTAYHFILGDMREVTDAMVGGESLSQRDNFVASHLLATLVIGIVTADQTVVLTIGDGVYAVNEHVTVLDSGEDNVPAYIAYGLMGGSVQAPPDSYRFTLQTQVPTASVNSLLVGTDGLGDLIDKCDHPLPGKPGEIVGPLSWFWSETAFKTSAKVERRLRLINREVVRAAKGGGSVETDRGLLDDDTSLVVMRRTKKSATWGADKQEG